MGQVRCSERSSPIRPPGWKQQVEAAKRGVKGKRKGKGEGKVGRPKRVKVAPVTPTTIMVPPVNTVLGEDVTLKKNNAVVPLCPSISASAEADDGDGEILANLKEDKKKRWEWDLDVPLGPSVLETSEKGGAVWKVYHVDRNFSPDTLPWIVSSLSPDAQRSGVLLPLLGLLFRFAFRLYMYAHLPAVSRSLVNDQ